MECNKDEAIRARTIAEEKLEKKDFAGAKKFALKAQNLYPGLEGLSQMLTTLEVYISAENKISGEVDWYGVLGVNPTADDETVRRQYRKLALILHPDKNKSVGADGAFKLLSEAWSLLSDKAKRLAYNQRRSLKGFQQRVPTHAGGPSAPPRANGYPNFTSRTHTVPKPQKHRMPSTSVHQSNQRSDTFWTICHRCKMHYEYLKMYLNHTLLCPNCHEAFLASETAPPFNYLRASSSSGRQRYPNSGNQKSGGNPPDIGRYAARPKSTGQAQAGPNSFGYTSFQHGMPPRMAGVGNTDPSIAAKAANVVQQAHEKMKRGRDEGQGSSGWEGSQFYTSDLQAGVSFKKSRSDDDGKSFGGNAAAGNGSYFGVTSAAGPRRSISEQNRNYAFAGTYGKPNGTRELTQFEIRNMLVEKTQKAIVTKLNEWQSEMLSKAADKEKKKAKANKREKERSIMAGGDDPDGSQFSPSDKAEQVNKSSPDVSSADTGKGQSTAAAMNVPDPDFHNFDLDRSESSFGDNEVWAAYDDDDGMPRFYALIHKVMSRNPFKLKLSWLNSKTNSEFGPLNWVASGFYKTCGEFRVGRYETSKFINSFSHKVNWSKGPRGTVHIFPKRGDVWALYKNWTSSWDEHTSDEVIHKYEMFVVLDDYSEEHGVSVAPLSKVDGFKTVFCPDMDQVKVRRIPKEEMFRFSHQVPTHMLCGEEAQNAPKGCLELDPAATPVDLLQKLSSVEVPVKQLGRDVEEGGLQKVPEGTVNSIGRDE